MFFTKSDTGGRPVFYWESHKKSVVHGRLAWYASEANEEFWHEYWKERIDVQYYESARTFDLTADELGQVLLEELSSSGIHLEAGCGLGFWVAALLGKGYDIRGIDYSRNLVSAINRTIPHLPITYGNVLAIDCPNGCFDTYLSIGVVEHHQEGPEPFIQEAYRVLKPGGKIIISVPFFGPLRRIKGLMELYERTIPERPFFQYGFTADEMKNFVRLSGFIVDSYHYHQIHRLLIEELSFYRELSYKRGGRHVKKFMERFFGGRDGHMLVIVGHKP